MMPLVPGITTARPIVERTLQAIAASGVPLAGSGVAHLEAGVRDHFLAFLSRTYPDLLEGYERLYVGAYAPVGYARQVSAMVRTLAAKMGLGRASRE